MAMRTFGLGFVPAPELGKSALLPKKKKKKNEDPKTLEYLMLQRHVSMSRYVISKRQQDFRKYILARYTENRWISWLFRNVREERSYVV